MEQASEKQIKYAKSLGIPNAEQFSKQALREMISQKTGKPLQSTLSTETTEKTQPQGSKKEFHLSEEQIRTNALTCAIEYKKLDKELEAGVLDLARQLEVYLRNG